MPLPLPTEGESKDEFISRCMGNEFILEDFDDQNQRFAVCQRQWDEGQDQIIDSERKNTLTNEYLSAFIESAKNYLDKDIYKEIHDKAFHVAGGKRSRRGGLSEIEKKVNDSLPDEIAITKNFINITGKAAKEDELPENIEILIRALSSGEDFLMKADNLMASLIKVLEPLKEICIKENPDGPVGEQYLPLYDLILRKRQSIKKQKAKKPEEMAVKRQIRKIDETKQLVYGVVLEPNTMDAHGDVISKKEVEEAAHFYMLHSQVVGNNHLTEAPARVVQSFIAPVDFILNGEWVKAGSWCLVTKITDDKLWQEILAGEYTGYSVGGFAIREEGAEGDLELDNILDIA